LFVHAPQGYSDGFETPLTQGQYDAVLVAGADHRLPRHHQRLDIADRMYLHLGVHVGLEYTALIGETQAHPQGAGFFFKGGVDVIHPTLPLATREVIQGHADQLAHLHLRRLSLEDLRLHPHVIQCTHRHQGGARHDVKALADIQVVNHPALGRAKGNGLAHLALAFQLGDEFRRQLQCKQAVPRRLHQAFITALEGQQQLFLGIDQLR
jgi:hypothetical protein